MKKILIVCLVVLIGVSMAGCAKMQEVSEIPGITFETPEKWAEYASQESSPGYNLWKYGYSFSDSEQIEVLASGGASDEQEAMDTFYMNNIWDKMEISNEEEFVIGDKTAQRVYGTIDINDVSYQCDEIVVQKGDYIYAFTYRWAVDQKPQYSKEYLSMIESIKFTAVDEKFAKEIAAAAESGDKGSLEGFEGSAVQMPVDEEAIKKNIKADSAIAGDGTLVTVFTNENDMTIPIVTVQVTFYDEAKKMLGTTEETFPVVAPGAKFAMGFESGSAKFTDYEMTISVDMRDYGETNYVDQISAEHNDADGKVVAKLTNNASETVNRLQVIAVFYNGDQVVGASYPSSEFDIAPGSSVTMELIAPFDGEKFEPLDYDRYEIFVNMAYTE